MKPIRVGLALINVLLLSVLVAVGTSSSGESGEHELVTEPVELAPVVPAGPVIEQIVHTVRSGETAGAILQRYGVTRVHELVELVEPHVDLGRVKAGQELVFTRVDGVPTQLSYRYSQDDTLQVELGDDIAVQVVTVRYERGLERVRIPIVGSLWQSAIDRGFSPAAVLEMSKVFENDVDFATDLRGGAAITVVVDRLSLDGEHVRFEDIHAMELENRGERLAAVYFDGSEARSGWYAPDGTSLEQPELAPPVGVVTGFGAPFAKTSYLAHQTNTKRDRVGLNELRIGADFYQRRCNGRCRHSALDFRASQGTPLVAIGTGKVNAITKPSTLCGSGVQLAIRGADGNAYTALYCHMSKVDVKVGQSVKKGQRVGLSGGKPGTHGAGHSTGAHLHLELRRKNSAGKYRLLDPLPMVDWRPFVLNVRYTKGHEPKAPELVVLPPVDIGKTPEGRTFVEQRKRWMEVLQGGLEAVSDAQPEGDDAPQG